MINLIDLLAAFLIGLGSSAHCIAMCGGIAAGFATQKSINRLPSILLFNLGRLISYALLGFLAGLLISSLSLQMSAFQFSIRILAGLMLVAMGLYVSGWWLGLARLEKLAIPLWAALQPGIKKLRRQNHLSSSLFLGLLWGLLPCGLIYSSLIWASATASALSPGLNQTLDAAIQSSLLMFFMGIGTLPTLLTVGFIGAQLVKAPLFRKISGILLVFYGLWTLAIPIQHLVTPDHNNMQMREQMQMTAPE